MSARYGFPYFVMWVTCSCLEDDQQCNYSNILAAFQNYPLFSNYKKLSFVSSSCRTWSTLYGGPLGTLKTMVKN